MENINPNMYKSTTIREWVAIETDLLHGTISIHSKKDPTSTEEAWAKTMEKWTELRDILKILVSNEVQLITIFLYGDSTCGLCNLHYRAIIDIPKREQGINCQNCPIYLVTGRQFCRGTPNEKIESVKTAEVRWHLKMVRKEIKLLKAVKTINKIVKPTRA